MSSYDGDPPGMAMTAKPTTAARKKIRPTYSCLSCHKRKVKCDRVKPCGACCLRGTPSECEYGTSKKDRHYIQQSTRIEQLTRTCEDLKRQLAEARQLANLPPIKDEDSPGGLTYIKAGLEDTMDEGDSYTERKSEKSSSGNCHLLALTKRGGSSSPESSPLSPSQEKAFLTDPNLADSLMELFVQRLISNFSPRDHAKYGGTIALREASEMRVLSPILCSAFEAASLTFVGRRDRNRSIELAGHARYSRMLRLLQNALYDPRESKSTEVLVVVLLSTIVEAFKQSSKDSILKHQLGGLELLRSRSPYRHRYGIERSLFVDLRMYWTTAALVHRKPTFLASKEWLTVPWPTDGPSKDILHRLLDVAVEIPGYLYQIDTFLAKLKAGSEGLAFPSDLVPLQSSIWEQASELQTRLNLWKTMHADAYPQRPWEEVDEGSPDGFPAFRCRDPTTMLVRTAKFLMYPDILLATSMCFYWALCLVVSATDNGLTSVMGLHERYQFACNICRSMRYYILHIPGCLVSRIMFVLRTAFDTFTDGMIEKEFMTELFGYIGRKFEFPVFSNQCTSSSVRKDSR
ncbi:hypothetical protein FE257_000884 [Aspergillus nanangensis]|uniref:Zn(2)-C6 fungal-type domain-containing protein n=1 Tax=Aspergillus nanangensis TaxID=2582783 RepID=A0AAD4CEF6_ASPNN|nr:hypothetical protein FE257_000884 [Aspergillus nanangensis]